MHYLIPALISGVGWGFFPLLDRFLLRYSDALTVSSLRGIILGLSAIFILIILLYKKSLTLKNGIDKGGNKYLLFLFLSPMLAFFLGHIGFYTSLKLASSSVTQVVLVTHCLPLILVAILAPCIYGDKINWQMIVGIILSIGGITMTVLYNPNH